MQKFITICFILESLQFTGYVVATPRIPTNAKVVIHQVNHAAKAQDFAALHALMVEEFVWSFGGDGDAKQTIEAWKKDPDALKVLYKVTRMKCTLVESDIVECPDTAGSDYRAGFKETVSGWRMIYFVAGD